MKKEKLTIDDVTWTCRFHPTDGFHEVGCSHMHWSKDDIYGALLAKKKFEDNKFLG